MTEQAADALIVICGLLGWSLVIALSAFGCIAMYDLWQEQKERKRRRMIRREMNRSRRLSQHGM